METITFHCKVITPMFLAGADGQTPELRAPSIKGAMRFWWRALNGHLGVEEMREKEVKIFGGAIGDKAFKSNVFVRIKKQNLNYSQDKFPYHNYSTYYRRGRMVGSPGREKQMDEFKINILDYLAFGISDRGNIGRPYITPGSAFQVELKSVKLSAEQFKGVIKAFVTLVQYGGLGSRSRNGFGGIKIENNGVERVRIDNVKSDIAGFTAASIKTEIVYEDEATHNSWDKALANIGKRYQNARETVERWHHYEKRVLLSHPTIIRERGRSKEVDETILENGRHSKPYFMHVEEMGKKQFIGQILCMPYDFLRRTVYYSQRQQEEYFKAIDGFNEKIKQK